MQVSWKPIFEYYLGDKQNSQMIYDEIFRSALTHKFAKSGLAFFRVDEKVLTDAIFDLNSHDRVSVRSGKKIREVTGQQLKELFITTIFLKIIESKIPKGSLVHLAVPPEPESTDTVVIVSEPNTNVEIIGESVGRLSSAYAVFPFQAKEYVDQYQLKETRIIAPEPVDIVKLTKLAGEYTEFVLVYFRAFTVLKSEDVDDFLKKKPDCYLIFPFSAYLEYRPNSGTAGKKDRDFVSLYPKPDKHNYVIVSPTNIFSTFTFNIPSSLIKDDLLPRF